MGQQEECLYYLALPGRKSEMQITLVRWMLRVWWRLTSITIAALIAHRRICVVIVIVVESRIVARSIRCVLRSCMIPRVIHAIRIYSGIRADLIVASGGRQIRIRLRLLGI